LLPRSVDSDDEVEAERAHEARALQVRRQFHAVAPPIGQSPQSPVHRLRLLLAHLGLLTWDQRGFRITQLNRASPKLHRDLKALDKQHG